MKLLITLMFVLSTQAFSQDAVIAVGNAEQDKDKLVIDDSEGKTALGAELVDILRNDFTFYKHKFNPVDYSEKGMKSYSNPQIAKWKESGINFFVASDVSAGNAKIKVWNVTTGKELLGQSYPVRSGEAIRSDAHKIANDIYRAITGKHSIFNSKIVFLSDRTTRGKDRNQEIYIMDFDGRRVEKLTSYDSLVMSPAISPDNSKVMFSLHATHKVVTREKVRMIKNIDLKSMDLKTRRVTTISDKPGINSGAFFNATGDKIYLTLTYSGNADIYEMTLATGALRKVTTSPADDVDPSINNDGTLMSFLSNRPGRAHIYTMDPHGTEKDVKRISFVGDFNATPRFSPDGKEIVFTSWVDNGFDLYRLSADGANLNRLTKDFGSNEEPVYSPDGEFIVFTSKRILSRSKSAQDLWIMNRDGEILGQLTQNFGHCLSPHWTNIPK